MSPPTPTPPPGFGYMPIPIGTSSAAPAFPPRFGPASSTPPAASLRRARTNLPPSTRTGASPPISPILHKALAGRTKVILPSPAGISAPASAAQSAREGSRRSDLADARRGLFPSNSSPRIILAASAPRVERDHDASLLSTDRWNHRASL